MRKVKRIITIIKIMLFTSTVNIIETIKTGNIIKNKGPINNKTVNIKYIKKKGINLLSI